MCIYQHQVSVILARDTTSWLPVVENIHSPQISITFQSQAWHIDRQEQVWSNIKFSGEKKKKKKKKRAVYCSSLFKRCLINSTLLWHQSLVCVAAESRSVPANKAILYFLLPAWHAIPLDVLHWQASDEKGGMKSVCVYNMYLYVLYMLLWRKCMLTRTCVFGEWGGCRLVEGRWFSHRPDWLPGSPAEPQTPLSPRPPLLTPVEADARFNTASAKQIQTPTVLLYVARRGCARCMVENPCLYRNHNTVNLQREAPAHARTTQNITDHLLNTEIEPHCNVKV